MEIEKCLRTQKSFIFCISKDWEIRSEKSKVINI